MVVTHNGGGCGGASRGGGGGGGSERVAFPPSSPARLYCLLLLGLAATAHCCLFLLHTAAEFNPTHAELLAPSPPTHTLTPSTTLHTHPCTQHNVKLSLTYLDLDKANGGGGGGGGSSGGAPASQRGGGGASSASLDASTSALVEKALEPVPRFGADGGGGGAAPARA